MRTVYVDTGAFLALLWQRDSAHQGARAHLLRLRGERARLVTSEAVIGETCTRLRYDAGLPRTLAFRDFLTQAAGTGALTVRESDAGLRQAAFEVMARYDGLTLSYADCIGAAVAAEMKADAVFGLDHDFRVMGFSLEP